MKAETFLSIPHPTVDQVGRGYPEYTPAEIKTSVTCPFGQGSSLVGEAGTENSAKRPPSRGCEETTDRKSGSPSLQAVGGGHSLNYPHNVAYLFETAEFNADYGACKLLRFRQGYLLFLQRCLHFRIFYYGICIEIRLAHY